MHSIILLFSYLFIYYYYLSYIMRPTPNFYIFIYLFIIYHTSPGHYFSILEFDDRSSEDFLALDIKRAKRGREERGRLLFYFCQGKLCTYLLGARSSGHFSRGHFTIGELSLAFCFNEILSGEKTTICN